jgi:hypothetical protein
VFRHNNNVMNKVSMMIEAGVVVEVVVVRDVGEVTLVVVDDRLRVEEEVVDDLRVEEVVEDLTEEDEVVVLI